MHYVAGMQVGHCKEHLMGGIRCLRLAEMIELSEPIEELATLHVLHDKVKVILGLIDHLQLCDVRMVQGQVDLRFVFEHAAIFGRSPLLREALDCIRPPVALASRELYGAVQPGAQNLRLDHEVVQQKPRSPVAAGDWYEALPLDDLLHCHERAPASQPLVGREVPLELTRQSRTRELSRNCAGKATSHRPGVNTKKLCYQITRA
mmetsp:Transcript_17647/g.49980  ORF Transcript_17647/g.49980 Transcript_17647/m.49980 type:complete len:205 (+) Transcript_17647:1238-1852(+)